MLFVFAIIGSFFHIARAVSTITDSNFASAVSTCLSTNPVDGLCSLSECGSMPDWDTSQVTSMFEAFKDKSTFNADIGNWNVASDEYGLYVS